MDRRNFIKIAGAGAVGVSVLGATGLLFRRTVLAERIPAGLTFFDDREFSVFASLAKRILPAEPDFEDAHLWVAEHVDHFLGSCERIEVEDTKKVLRLFDNALAGLVIAGSATPFTRMDPDAQMIYLNKWRLHKRLLFRSAFAALKRLAVTTYYGNPKTWKAIGYPGPPDVSLIDVMEQEQG